MLDVEYVIGFDCNATMFYITSIVLIEEQCNLTRVLTDRGKSCPELTNLPSSHIIEVHRATLQLDFGGELQ